MKIITTSRQFGNQIKRLRKACKLTQRSLAAAAGTGVRFIQDLEKGKETCELNKSLRVASMLGIRLEAHTPKVDMTNGKNT